MTSPGLRMSNLSIYLMKICHCRNLIDWLKYNLKLKIAKIESIFFHPKVKGSAFLLQIHKIQLFLHHNSCGRASQLRWKYEKNDVENVSFSPFSDTKTTVIACMCTEMEKFFH